MKYCKWFFCSVLVTAFLLKDSAFSQSHPKREFRGAWIATVVNLDWPTSATSPPGTQQAQLITMLDQLKAAGINAVIFQIRPECDALYASSYEPWSYWLTGSQGTPPSPYYDPLEFAIAEVHQRGMELHAWFNPYRAVRVAGSYTIASNHVAALHPEWVITIGNFKFLDPGQQAVRDYNTRVIMDVVRRYDIDGVHFDDYFYPYPPDHMTANSTNNALDDASYFNDPRGFASKNDWRRDNINIFVKQVHDSLRAVKPHVKFGISPFGIWRNGVPSGIEGMDAYTAIYCDPMAWLNQQTLDYVTPQLYWKIGGSQDYSKLMPWWADSIAVDGRHFYTGNIFGSGYSASELPSQLRLNRGNIKVQGSILFRASFVAQNSQGFSDTLKSNLYRYPALLPVMNWKDTLKPNAPQNFRYERLAATGPAALQWNVPTPSGDGDTASRYVVYRFSSPTIQPTDLENPANIVSIEGRVQSIPTAPAGAGPYYYAATALDRNYNESAASAVLSVSAPPAPLLAFPANGAIDQPPDVMVTWNSSNLAASYRVQVASDTGFAGPLLVNDGAVVDTFRVIAGMDGQQRYYWRSNASNAGGTGEYSPTWSLVTGFPATPLLSMPANISADIPANPVFAWYPAAMGTTYRFQLSKSSDFAAMVKDTSGLTDTLLAVSQLEGYKIYFWRVSSSNSIGSSKWSDTWRFRTATISLVAEELSIPQEHTLSQNYPNPFNATTQVKFALPLSAPTSLRVYDILGREVAVLVDEVLPAGTFTAHFDATRLPSGTYIYVLTSGGKRLSNKMLLIK